MSIYPIAPLDLSGIRTVSLASRPSKVRDADFARPVEASHAAILDSLPDILAARDLKRLAAGIHGANRSGRRVIFGLGAHVFKVGLTPILIQLVESGFVDAFALNGAGIVHDFEIAACGSTSEDVDAALPDGRFGVTRETGEALNGAIRDAAREDVGIGEAVGRLITTLETPTARYSLLGACYRRRIPVTVHVAIGTDVLHVHPAADGAAIGAASHRDFRLFAALVAGLHGGGVYLNIGSAVILPEVFLKAVSVVRNLGMPLEGFTTANLDFFQHYRPLTNVVRRPTTEGGRGYALTGHHELLFPLLAAAVVEEWEEL
jgi:hypothetical protein